MDEMGITCGLNVQEGLNGWNGHNRWIKWMKWA
jgi:hypothetical protein